ncbi:hypothetical protein K502DRAFT_242132 [Neoconidiobolus thromboides FSU 785]|nr:hypothetical protein K502DRAFT_242132 [Neoconidiobolus thromboides FSU 785]
MDPNALKTIAITSNTISIIFTATSIVLFITISIINNNIYDSLVYRLSAIILFGNLILNIINLIQATLLINSTISCYVLEFLSTLSISLSMLYATVIATILLINVIYLYEFSKRARCFTYLIPIFLSLLLAGLQAIIGNIENINNQCGYSNVEDWLSASLIKLGSVIVSIILCPISYFTIFIYINIRNYNSNQDVLRKGGSFKQLNWKVLLKLLAYPTIPILSYLFYFIILYLITYSEEELSRLSQMYAAFQGFSKFLFGFQGVLNACLFFNNTIFLKELKKAYCKLSYPDNHTLLCNNGCEG